MKYVIIGNSAAAVGCIEGIRQNDTKSSITLISNEPYHTYSRPLISYLIYEKTDRERMKYRSDHFYEIHSVTALLGKTAVKIDTKKKEVVLEDKTAIPYDKLLVATGSKPFIPPMDELGSVMNKFTFMSLDDALALEKSLTPKSKVLIIGAGLIGLKCAEGIQNKVKSITVVDLADRILPSILDGKGSDIVKRHIEEKGVRFILSDSIKTFQKTKALLKSGETVDFDALVIAVGVRPNTELVFEAGGEVNRGIVTDQTCSTSLPDIYAAGDCTESFNITTRENQIMALLPNAYMQGECAGKNMSGVSASYTKAIPMNAIGFFGLHMITAGIYNGEAYITQVNDQTYKKLIVKDNLLKGFIMIGDIKRAGIYTSLIREERPLDTIDFHLIKNKPQLMAFTKSDRKKQLSSQV